MITNQAYYKNLSYTDLVEMLAEATKRHSEAVVFLQNEDTVDSYRQLIIQLQAEIQRRMPLELEKQIA
jgi:hypothetical protein